MARVTITITDSKRRPGNVSTKVVTHLEPGERAAGPAQKAADEVLKELGIKFSAEKVLP
ncbi:hypothetical protein [Dongia sp.]|uniref:hypothetical protein n=1 Tax=Dongia sp. TaxID=1977262 RepID=UPI0035AEE684